MPNFTISATTLTFPDGSTMTTAAQSIPSGTVTNFFQASAPTGWTKLTANDNASIRIVSGTGGGTGGSVNFTSAFASQPVGGTTDGTTLSLSQIPSHNHSGVPPAYTIPTGPSATVVSVGSAQGSGTLTATPNQSFAVASGGSSGSHNHTFTGTAINLAVKYLDNIMCSKN